MPRPVKHPEQYVPALDGLRTIAVALVVFYHLSIPGFSGGLMGVAVFFTLSGYLITTNLVNAKLTHNTFRLRTFWVRRFRRLLPAVITTILAVLFLTVAFDAPSLLSAPGRHSQRCSMSTTGTPSSPGNPISIALLAWVR